FRGNDGDRFYLYTNYEAHRGRGVAGDLRPWSKTHWQETGPEEEGTMIRIVMVRQRLISGAFHYAGDELASESLEGEKIETSSVPAVISLTDVSGKKESDEMLLGYTSYLSPNRLLRYDFKAGELEPIFEDVNVPSAGQDFETEQIFFESKDGTRVPMFMTHKKGIELDGNNPVMLFGYGGYNISLTPGYSPAHQLWLEAGGVYVEVNLRGGGEFGEAWHLDGILDRSEERRVGKEGEGRWER